MVVVVVGGGGGGGGGDDFRRGKITIQSVGIYEENLTFTDSTVTVFRQGPSYLEIVLQKSLPNIELLYGSIHYKTLFLHTPSPEKWQKTQGTSRPWPCDCHMLGRCGRLFQEGFHWENGEVIIYILFDDRSFTPKHRAF